MEDKACGAGSFCIQDLTGKVKTAKVRNMANIVTGEPLLQRVSKGGFT
ncbi:MAG: hypothetical protein ACYCS8_17335 [Acidithiobacillus sp.]